MGFAFNPFTGNFDQKGSGGGASYIDGEEAVYGDLSLDAGVAPLNSAWLVRSASGVWPVSRKQAGIYIRTATAGSSRDADYTYAGTMPDVFSDANFTIYDDADTSKNLKFQLSGLATGTTSTLTVPASGTIARTQDFAAPPAIGSTTPSTGAFTTLNANNGTITSSTPAFNVAQTWNAGTAVFTASTSGSTLTVSAMTSGTIEVGMEVSIGGVPRTITAFGTGTGGTGTYTFDGTASVGSQSMTATRPLTAAVVNATNTASAFTSRLLDLQVGGTSQFWVSRIGTLNVGAGTVTMPSIRFPGGNLGIYSAGANDMSFTDGNNRQIRYFSGNFGFTSDMVLYWGNSTSSPTGADTRLLRDAAGTLAQVNGNNAQASLLYGRFTSSTNYQRLAIRTKIAALSALSGASVTTTGGFIPDGAVLIGLTTRVSTAITGATGYDIGDGADADRWGANIGVALNTSSDNTNWTATTIQCFTAAQEVTLTAVGSNFTAGEVVIVAHYLAGEAD